MAGKTKSKKIPGKAKSSTNPRKTAERGVFGEKIFTVEEEHSLLLFVAGIVFGIGLVSLSIKEYYYTAIALFVLFLVLVFIDKRIESMK